MIEEKEKDRVRQHDKWMEKREGGGGLERRVEADRERGERWRCGKLMGGQKQRPGGHQLDSNEFHNLYLKKKT